MNVVHLQQQDQVGSGHLFTVQSARPQADDSHVADSGVGVGDAGQNLFRPQLHFSSAPTAFTRTVTVKMESYQRGHERADGGTSSGLHAHLLQ